MFIKAIEGFAPTCEQERMEKAVMLKFARENRDTVLFRENQIAHMTGSSMIFNTARTKVLMAHHNIYNSWAWTGGHADGEADLLALALREAQEETGVKGVKVLCNEVASLDILAVPAHFKRGAYVPPHLHLSLAYLFQADENEETHLKADENSAVAWLPIESLEQHVTEEEMLPVYKKLIEKMRAL
ncbi:NUDIX hydrolase [Ruminococcaceae bacterium OttesenSCG-928-N02]|nr:NUDIX hydrolase [Ruminococcaceae bacterium OttesenSCG-928-N02]